MQLQTSCIHIVEPLMRNIPAHDQRHSIECIIALLSRIVSNSLKNLLLFLIHPHLLYLPSSTPVKVNQSNSNTPNMGLRTFFALLTFFLAANAAPMQPRQPTSRPAPTLSNEVIVGLFSLFVAVFGISITLIASPKMRRNIKSEPMLAMRLSCRLLIVH
jgi:hypothetical protein